jgi:hypothetical protein
VHLPATSSHDGILRTAHFLIAEYGDKAALRAARRVFEMLDLGKVNEADDWRRIMAAVDKITAWSFKVGVPPS